MRLEYRGIELDSTRELDIACGVNEICQECIYCTKNGTSCKKGFTTFSDCDGDFFETKYLWDISVFGDDEIILEEEYDEEVDE